MNVIKQNAVIEYFQNKQPRKQDNLLFFLQDFPEPQPYFPEGAKLGEMIKSGVELVTVNWNGSYKITTAEEAEKFNLQYKKF